MKRLLFVILLLPILAWAAPSPDGTWKVDINKVQFPEKPDTWVLLKGLYQCPTCVPKIDIKADGKDQPVSGSKYYDTMAVKVVDDKTIEVTNKKGGKVVAIEKFALSANGKTLTIEFSEFPEASKQPITGKITQVRVADGPSGSHALSGSWRTQKADAVSDNALTFTYKSTPNGMMSSSPTGQSYDAKFGGKDYPVKGDVGGTTVSLSKANDGSFIETYKRDGKIVEVDQITVSADGKTLSVKSENKERGTTATFTATKQ
jgi:hypothetical protein